MVSKYLKLQIYIGHDDLLITTFIMILIEKQTNNKL